MKVSKRGGARPGAGRPKGSGTYGEATRQIRVPLSLIDRVMKIINAYRESKKRKK